MPIIVAPLANPATPPLAVYHVLRAMREVTGSAHTHPHPLPSPETGPGTLRATAFLGRSHGADGAEGPWTNAGSMHSNDRINDGVVERGRRGGQNGEEGKGLLVGGEGGGQACKSHRLVPRRVGSLGWSV